MEYQEIEDRLVVGYFEGGYNRNGYIWISNDDQYGCDVCGEKALVLNMDGSEDEYGAGCICLKCINDGFHKFQAGLRGEAPEVLQKQSDVHDKHEQERAEDLAEWQKEAKKHLTYCDDRKCTHLVHEWNRKLLAYQGVGRKLIGDVLSTDEGKEALAAAFYVMPEPKGG